MSVQAVVDSDRQMLRPALRALTLLLAGSMAAGGLLVVTPVRAAATSTPLAGAVSSTGLCAAPLPGHSACLVRARTIGGQRVSQRPGAAPATGTAGGYGPADVASAYNLPAGAGSGQTVGIVDAFDNSHVAADLTAYRAYWGLPPAPWSMAVFARSTSRAAPPTRRRA
jgi:hypothetical protein